MINEVCLLEVQNTLKRMADNLQGKFKCSVSIELEVWAYSTGTRECCLNLWMDNELFNGVERVGSFDDLVGRYKELMRMEVPDADK